MDTKQPEALRVPEIARYCFRSEGMSDPPEQFESPTGDMVDYFDHIEIEKELLARITELESQLAQRFDAAPAQPAAQQGVAYAALPDEGEPWRGHKFKEVQRGCWRCDCGKTIKEVTSDQSTPASGGTYPVMPKRYTVDDDGEELFTAEKMRAFADATCALRASHGQAPADAKALAEADRRAGEAERILATCKENVMRFEQVRSRMKYQWGADQRVSFDEVWDEALALKKAAQAAPQAADSVTAPAPPPECETEAEKRAFAFGWFKALESERMKADSVQEDAARESEYRRGYRHGYEQRDAEVRGAMA